MFIARKGTFGFRSGYGSNRTLIRFVPNEVRKYTLIALSTTGKFPDTVKEGTTYTATEFEMVLNSLRNMNTVKAEEPHEFTIKGN